MVVNVCRYMWPDSTLRDVAESLRVEVITALTSTSFSALNSKLDMAVVFMSQRAGNVVMRDVCISRLSWCYQLLKCYVYD